METAQVSLRACPHCGTRPIFGAGNSAPYQVECHQCDMAGPKADTQVKAIKAWNRIARLVKEAGER